MLRIIKEEMIPYPIYSIFFKPLLLYSRIPTPIKEQVEINIGKINLKSPLIDKTILYAIKINKSKRAFIFKMKLFFKPCLKEDSI